MLIQDVRYALRNLSRSKGFATVAILCLGFGVGLNATIFSLIDGILLKPYPYTEPDLIGHSILVNGKPHIVVGVMPQGFAFPNNQKIWMPLTPLVAKDQRSFRGLFAFARLKPGVSMGQARQELDAIAKRLGSEYPET